MDALFDQVQTLALQADVVGRHKVLDFLRSLQLKLETPHDTLSRYSGLVSTKDEDSIWIAGFDEEY